MRDLDDIDYKVRDANNVPFCVLALLELKATKGPLCAMETRHVKTACLPNQAFPDDKECVITAWGRTQEGKVSNLHISTDLIQPHTSPKRVLYVSILHISTDF